MWKQEAVVIVEKNKLVEMFSTMVRIRHFENKVRELRAQGMLPGAIHLYIGEEAVAVGACASLRKDDYITSTHRGHGHCIAKGGRMDKMMAELFGKATGYCKGKGGSMHIADFDIGMLGACGIVGGGIPIATGAALSAKLRGTGQVAVCFFGDGASNQGTFHEAINIAALWKLPVVYVCENNQYAISTHVLKSLSIENVADRAMAYGIPGVVVDGNEVMAVYEAVGEAVKRARRGEGPSLIECKTYRWRGHFEGDPGDYRTREEVEEWERKCPIKRFRERLLKIGVLTKDDDHQIEEEAKEEVNTAVDFAMESPDPVLASSLEDVYV